MQDSDTMTTSFFLSWKCDDSSSADDAGAPASGGSIQSGPEGRDAYSISSQETPVTRADPAV